MEYFLLRTFWKSQKVESLPEAVGWKQTNNIGYTTVGFISMLLVLCIGCFSFMLIYNLFNQLLPAQLKDNGADNKTIALIITTMPYAVTMIVNPICSFWSDRLRTKIGRRIPFILVCAPFMALFLIALGWAPQIGAYLARNYSIFPTLNMSFIMLAIFAVLYQFVFMIPGAVFWYLFPDVVPQVFMSRFMALFQVVSSSAGFIFSRWLLPFAGNNASWLYTIIAIFYLITTLIMCFNVKEGAYPKNQDDALNQGIIASIKIYIRECYSVPFYFSFFIVMALSEVSMICRNMYNLIYAQKSLGLSLETYGAIWGWYAAVGLVLSFPFGWLADRIHPMKVYGMGLFLVVITNAISFFYVKDEKTFLITTIILGVVYTIQMVSTIPVFVAILPKDLYGQFCSANALFRAVFMAICGYGGGIFLDWIGDYQYIYVWDFIFTLAALLAFVVLYITWQQRGGAKSYIAPVKTH